MHQIDQNSAMNSMEQALSAHSSLVDGRTEKDWLYFLAEFASLINFYDNNNTIRGNWAPFLMKDPVFLFAAISKTRLEKFESAYKRLAVNLQGFIAKNKDPKEISHGFNQLFDLLTDIFMRIKRWVYYMQLSVYEYPLKTYVANQVKSSFSRYFWALISLQQNLFLSGAIQGIVPVDHSRLVFFDLHDELIWKQNKDKSPYWDVLDLNHPIKKNDPAHFLKAVTKVGGELLAFFKSIIMRSASEYEMLKTQKSKYPDTLLLRSFIDLLKIHQQQLNGITQRHLRFYYKDILKQEMLPATADEVFICATLAKKDSVFMLPAGTLFDAGVDLQNDPVSFASKENVYLNPATIGQALSLAIVKDADGFYSCRINDIPDPGTLIKSDDGKIQSWQTFGGDSGSLTVEVKPAIIIASPLLLLKEGQRNISLTLNFAGAIDKRIFSGAVFYVSSQTDWLPVKSDIQFSPGSDADLNQVILCFELNPEDPGIENFEKHPDGLDSAWPMLKIIFGQGLDFSAPPLLKTMSISVKVSGIKTFVLYNDNGLLAPQKPYLLFGPTPAVNSSFIIGSSEIFSKPINSLGIELDWDKLPDFPVYYKQYNYYIRKQLKEAGNRSFITRIKDFFLTPFRMLWCWIKSLWPKKFKRCCFKNEYSNTCFTVKFEILQDHQWKDLPLKKVGPFAFVDNEIQPTPYAGGNGCCEDPQNPNMLFSTQGDDCSIYPFSYFAYTEDSGTPVNFDGDPGIQQSALQFTDDTACGFLKMSLDAPEPGFGWSIYANVVSFIALHNARELSRAAADDFYTPKFIDAANVPYAPKLTGLSGCYTASVKYDLTSSKQDYPLQCFLNNPFGDQMIYPSNGNVQQAIQKPGTGIRSGDGLLLHHAFDYKGYLFVGFDGLISGSTLDLYFELARKYPVSIAESKITYFYLSTAGWKELEVLSDGTKNFICSGIIKLAVPDDIDPGSKLMPAKKYWMAIATENDPALFARTVLLKTNGIKIIRTGNIVLPAGSIPELPAGSIARTRTSIPRISAIEQPFPSFGGKAGEDEMMMNRRVSRRIKTKDRVVFADDYYNLVSQEFKDIYYSKAIFDEIQEYVNVYVVKAVDSITAPHAFLPLVTACKEKTIGDFLQERTSAFLRIRVSNFKLQFVQVSTLITIKEGFGEKAVKGNIMEALNLFLSPWIRSRANQIRIGDVVTEAGTAALIKEVDGVDEVQTISFKTWQGKDSDFQMPDGLDDNFSVRPMGDDHLIVSGMNHIVQFKSTA